LFSTKKRHRIREIAQFVELDLTHSLSTFLSLVQDEIPPREENA
jgi:hypothetical protein